MKYLWEKFKRDERGNLAVIFAVSAVPIMLISSAALDLRYAERTDNNLQQALDTAALAAVANPNFTDTERRKFAAKIFNENFAGKHRAILSYPKSEEYGVFTIAGNVTMPTTLGAMVNMKSLTVDGSSSAILQEEGSICVLALAETGAGRLNFSDNAAFSAPNCTIQVNSADAAALTNSGTTIPKSSGFCTVGGGSGNFEPALNSECAPIPDPYANLTPPDNQRCLSFSNLGALAGQFRLALNDFANARNLNQSDNGTGSNVTMRPGIYCGGLTVDGIDVNFLPGTYIIKDGDLTFKNISQAQGLGVTFILTGNSALNIELGAELKVKAPKDGDYAGIAFYQVPPTPDEGEESFGSEETLDISYPTDISTISSGGKLDVDGTLYFPTQALKITGDSFFGSQAKATSFIAYEVEFSGDTIAMVSVDYRAAGLPPLEPRSSGGPRLLR